jgi:S-adenosylmethionine decarboxylase
MSACSFKYSRASFLFPDDQPHLYQSFDREVDFLRITFGPLGHHGSVAILGDAACDLQWHLFSASDEQADVPAAESVATATSDPTSVERNCDCSNADELSIVDSAGMGSVCEEPSASAASSASSDTCTINATEREPLSTFEVCMTELDESAAQQFVRTGEFVSSAHTTQASGIRALVPEAHMDDYVFEPCGCALYSPLTGHFATPGLSCSGSMPCRWAGGCWRT